MQSSSSPVTCCRLPHGVYTLQLPACKERDYIQYGLYSIINKDQTGVTWPLRQYSADLDDKGCVKPRFISMVNMSSGGFVSRYLGTLSAVQKSSLMSHGLQNRLNTTCRRTTAHTITHDQVTTWRQTGVTPHRSSRRRSETKTVHCFKYELQIFLHKWKSYNGSRTITLIDQLTWCILVYCQRHLQLLIITPALCYFTSMWCKTGWKQMTSSAEQIICGVREACL